MSITRRDLAEALKAQAGGTIETHDDWIDRLLQVISDKVADGERIELRGFGTFESREIRGHKTTNPVTGEPMQNPKSYTVDFRPAQGFKDKLRPKKASRKKKSDE
jgi:DNA-binding protein HU-beta